MNATAAPAPDEASTGFDVRLSHEMVSRERRFALDVSLRTDARRVVLMGPSGAGKTMTMQAIAGLVRPRAGRVAVDGETLLDTASSIDLPARARGFGVVFQDYALFPHLSVRQNVAFGLRIGWRNPSPRATTGGMARSGTDDGDDDARVAALLRRLGLEPVAHQRPHELSGGQRQRTALARALVTRPRALLLDEPFAALDPALRERLRDELDALLRETDVPMLMITHDEADRERFGECAFVIEDGRSRAVGDARA